MTNKGFDMIVAHRTELIRKVLIQKAKEYASNEDRLHNFKRAAAVLGCSPEQALRGMWAKHLVSVFDLIDKPELRTCAMVDEKIGDSINYLILLEALMKEDGKCENSSV